MAKIIGVENTERINAELEKLIEEVKKELKQLSQGLGFLIWVKHKPLMEAK